MHSAARLVRDPGQDDPRGAIDRLCKAFGFSVRILVDGPEGGVAHSEPEYGDSLIMVAGCRPGPAGEGRSWAEVVSQPQDVDYGPDHWRDRNYCCLDCEGHVWWFMQRL